MTADFAASWFNRAATQGRQVVLDSRCGLPGDFDTSEYAHYGAVQRRKWESNLGMGMNPITYPYPFPFTQSNSLFYSFPFHSVPTYHHRHNLTT